MHVLFLAPFFNQPRGNSTTIKRLVHFLQQQDILTSVIPYLENDNWNDSKADIYHILHATRFIKWQKENQFVLDRPYIVTMGGTDINIDLQERIDAETFTFLNDAAFITVFTEDGKEKVSQLNSNWREKTIVIPQGIWLPWTITPLKEELHPRIFLPAGLRPVKDVLHPLPALDELVSIYPNLDFTILGANLDEDVLKKVQAEEKKRDWMKYAGVVPYEVMKVWYERADIVINTSKSEGQSLALMEAMALGRPVIARKNEANSQFIRHGETGLLYETKLEFLEAVQMIESDIYFRNKLIEQAKEEIRANHSPMKEVLSYIHLYKQIY